MTNSTRHRRCASTRIRFESLESRNLLAAFGTPWPTARSLTISFPSDGTSIGEHSNDLEQTFDAVTSRSEWQELALRAFQTWSVHADINVGLRNDHDLGFGTSGLTSSDPRFGDFRIGAFPQVGVLANAIPFQAVAGTHSGDILINSNETYTYHDWSGGVGPDPSSQQSGQWDMFSVLLHETGNALGIDDNFLDWTVMFGQYTVPKGMLSQHDIDQIQSLYGARTDPYEQVANDQLQLATLLPTPVGFQPETDRVTVQGSLRDSTDIDYFEITPVAGEDELSIRLRASGISLLKSRVQVLDAGGQVLVDSIVDSAFQNDHAIQVGGLQNQSTPLYVRVSATDQDVFSVGDYELSLDYRGAAAQASDPNPSPYDAGVDSLWTNFALADAEQGSNDSVTTATDIDTAAGFAVQTRYEIHSSVSSSSDVDFLKVTAPSDPMQRLVITLDRVGVDQPDLRVRVVDADGIPVGASGRIDDNGMWTLEVAQPQSNQDYFLKISVDPNSTVGVGNYVATAEFVTASDQMNQLVSGDVSSTIDDFVLWSAGKTRLYRFELGVEAASNNDAVQVTFYDAHTHEVRMVLTTPSGRTRSAFAWLNQGDYIVRFAAVSRVGVAVSNAGYTFAADGISDDQNPEEEDGDPDDEYNYYEYSTPPEVTEPNDEEFPYSYDYYSSSP